MNEWYQKPAMRPYQEFFILMGLWVAGLFAAGVTSLLIWMSMTGLSPLEMGDKMLLPEFRSVSLVVQSASSVFIFLLPALVTIAILSRRVSSDPVVSSRFHWKKLLLVVVLMTAAAALAGALGELNKAIPLTRSLREYFDQKEEAYNSTIRSFISFKSFSDYLILLVVIALLPALGEEFLFRGAMQPIFIKWFKYPLLAIFVTSFIFSAIHLSWYGFIPRLVLGMVLGYMFYYTKNLWYSILAHFVNNGLMVTLLYIDYLQTKKIDLENTGSMPWWGGVIAMVVVLGLLKLLRDICTTKVAEDSLAQAKDENTVV